MEQIPDLPIFSKNVFEMITVAHDFCITLRKTESLKKKELAEYLAKVGPLLYLKGALLPDVVVSDPDANERFLIEEEYEALLISLYKKFGDDNEIWVAEVEKNAGEMVKYSLAELLTDIYQEMFDFLELYQKNSRVAKENAVFELKNAFTERWGEELLKALNKIHHIAYQQTEIKDSFDIPELF